MREIKFRAWDKRFKLMLYPDNFYNEYISADGKVIEIEEWSDYSGGGFHTNDVSQDYILMQYTGLKDGTKWEQLTKEEQNDWQQSGKRPEEWKGREIYEGDLFKIENHWSVYTVVYSKEEAAFGLQSRGGPFKSFKRVLEESKDYPLSEVLGNIYENPDLVGDQDGD